MAEATVVDNRDAGRFELIVDGQVAELVYRRHGDRLVLVHTGVPEELEERGLGAELVAAALDVARAEHLTVVPVCPFAAGWLERHPERAQGVTIDRAEGDVR